MQADWRWCRKCQGLAFSAHGSGICPARGSHDYSQSGNYELPFAGEGAGQVGWRWCLNCQGLAFSGQGAGVCPAGGAHDYSQSGDYAPEFATAGGSGQAGWRWCLNCQGLAFSGQGAGVCPAGGAHDYSQSGDYMLSQAPSGPRNPMLVGFNYPWAWDQYGLYFGAGKPPGNDPSYDRWIADLRTNLHFLQTDLNILHVRIFLLCNAWNYGDITSTPPPTVPFLGTPLHTRGRDRFTPPASLDPKYTDHLKKMLDVFQAEEMFVLPSFVDFGCFRPESLNHPTNHGAGGRAEIITNSSFRSNFLKVLDTFLTVSIPYASVIDAWEVINEPIWNMSFVYGAALAFGKWGRQFAPDADVLDTDMAAFVEAALRLIARFHSATGEQLFASSVGHRFYSDLSSYPTATGTIRQFHYYPQTYAVPALPGLSPQTLPYSDPDPLPTYAQSNAIIGEFSCKLTGEGDPWPELNGADTRNVRDAVTERLRLLNQKGYPIAYLWFDLPPSPYPGRDNLKLSIAAQDGIKGYNASP